MASEVIERMARAMYETHGFKRPWDHVETQRIWHPHLIVEAEAALKALRTPTKHMLMASGFGKTQKAKWEAMVDEAQR